MYNAKITLRKPVSEPRVPSAAIISTSRNLCEPTISVSQPSLPAVKQRSVSSYCNAAVLPYLCNFCASWLGTSRRPSSSSNLALVPRIAQQVANCTASSLSLQNQPCRCFSDLCVPATCGRSLRAIWSSDLSWVLPPVAVACRWKKIYLLCGLSCSPNQKFCFCQG